MNGFVFRSWPEEKTLALKALWWDGVSAEEIAITLNAASARAVSEKAQREGFTRNPELKRRATPHEIPALILPHIRDDGTLVTMENCTTRECRYIADHPPRCDSPMCGRPVGRGAWCREHRKIVYMRGTAAPVVP